MSDVRSVPSVQSTHMGHLDRVKEYARIRRGEHPGWEGDAVRNGESYAFRLGMECEEAAEMVRSLGIAEREYSLLTGLPPGSLRRLTSDIKRGIRAAKGAKQ